MQQNQIESFPTEVIDKLGFYVYRLIDPRNGETFYVGKGKGNRVFQHARAAGKIEDNGTDDDEASKKIQQIREIHRAGLDVGHVIHRHGMDEATAFQVEAALMDAYPSSHNEAAGTGNGDFSSMHAVEIITKYRAEPAVFEHKVILITINKSLEARSLYDATRFAWKISAKKAAEAAYVLPVSKGIIRGAFIADEWLPATAANFADRGHEPDRMGFIGREASDEIKSLYVNKRVPDEFRQQGASNPIRYSWRQK